jgi:hypothetical protein
MITLRRQRGCALGKLKESPIPAETIVSETVLDDLKRIAPGSVDLVCLSEMVFTGGYTNLNRFKLLPSS